MVPIQSCLYHIQSQGTLWFYVCVCICWIYPIYWRWNFGCLLVLFYWYFGNWSGLRSRWEQYWYFGNWSGLRSRWEQYWNRICGVLWTGSLKSDGSVNLATWPLLLSRSESESRSEYEFYWNWHIDQSQFASIFVICIRLLITTHFGYPVAFLPASCLQRHRRRRPYGSCPCPQNYGSWRESNASRGGAPLPHHLDVWWKASLVPIDLSLSHKGHSHWWITIQYKSPRLLLQRLWKWMRCWLA